MIVRRVIRFCYYKIPVRLRRRLRVMSMSMRKNSTMKVMTEGAVLVVDLSLRLRSVVKRALGYSFRSLPIGGGSSYHLVPVFTITMP